MPDFGVLAQPGLSVPFERNQWSREIRPMKGPKRFPEDGFLVQLPYQGRNQGGGPSGLPS